MSHEERPGSPVFRNASEVDWIAPTHETTAVILKKVLLARKDLNPNSKLMMVNLAEMKPGSRATPHKHETMDEVYYFLKGEGKVRIGEIERLVIEGGIVLAPAGIEHTIENVGYDYLVFLAFGVALD